MTCRLRHLSPEALAPDGLCCSAHHRSIGLIRQSGELRVLSRTPVMDAVLDIQGSQHPVCPPHRSFTAELSRIAATCTPGDPVRASQFFRTGTGDRVERRPLASTNIPASRIPCGEPFKRRFIRTFAFATALPVARLPVRPDRNNRCPPSPQRLLRPCFRTPGHPDIRRDMTTAPN